MTLGRFVRGTSVVMQVLTVTLALGGLAYRSTYYWVIPVAPGDPYGVGDVLGLIVGMSLVVVSGSCVILGLGLLAFPGLNGRRHGFISILVAVASFFGYYYLHGRLPRLL